MPDSYDAVRYPSFPRNQTHPAFVSALAALAGLELPSVEQWSVLEIGCGDGSNILPLAVDYPKGRFVGVDRALNPLARGRALAARLQLANIHLLDADLLQWQPEGGFDYIIAHGVFSWVSQEIRGKILRICSKALKTRGIAFISYNALPGCHYRKFAWDFLRFHVRRQNNEQMKVEKALELARLIAGRSEEEGPAHSAVRQEMETVLKRDEAVLYHDDLSDINEPFYLLEFVNKAAKHGLQYLGDADPQRDDIQGSPLVAEDWLESRQYGDFLAKRRFRETLLCRRKIRLDRNLLLDRFRKLFVASQVKPSEPQRDGQQSFALGKSGSLTTNHPLAKEMLCRLASLWPRWMQISEFPLQEYPSDATAALLLRMIEAKALEVRIHPPKIAESISNRPTASALARAQIAEDYPMVTNQRHINIEIKDNISRMLLSLLDGNRDRAAIAREMLVPDLGMSSKDCSIEKGLTELHKLCLLTR